MNTAIEDAELEKAAKKKAGDYVSTLKMVSERATIAYKGYLAGYMEAALQPKEAIDLQELLDFVDHVLTKRKKKQTDDYEHIGATIKAKIKLTISAQPKQEAKLFKNKQ